MTDSEQLSVDKSLSGFIQIWQTNPETGDSALLVDKPNMILRGGTKLLAQLLGGKTESKIWGMYIGFNNNASFTPPTIDVDYTNTFASQITPFGYLREPLTFSPHFSSSANYADNIVLFTTMITAATSVGGAPFNTNSRMYEVALVAAPTPDNANNDVVFSRTSFSPIQYNPSYNFSITWGVRILLP